MEAQVVAVVGAAGGVGASTLAALLARERARSAGRTVLVGSAVPGPGLHVLLGTEGRAGARWADLRHAGRSPDVEDLDGVLPRWEGVEVLASEPHAARSPDPEVVTGVVRALATGARTVVLDVPAADLHHGVPWPVPPAATVVVTHQDVLGVAAALGLQALLPEAPGSLILRRRRAARVAPVEAAGLLGLPVIGVVGEDGAVAASTDRGLGPWPSRRGGLRRAVAALDGHLERAHAPGAASGRRRRVA